MHILQNPVSIIRRSDAEVRRVALTPDLPQVTHRHVALEQIQLQLKANDHVQIISHLVGVRDLAKVWRERYMTDLGITPLDDRDGVLQDVHWYSGPIGGAFQGYTLGNILNAQFYEVALRAHPEIPAQIEQGEFGTLHHWLKENLYQHGAKFTTSELVERVTGGPMRIEPYIRYLRAKYGKLYSV